MSIEHTKTKKTCVKYMEKKLGRGKKKRVAKRRRKMFNRNAIRVKMGKPIFFTLTHCSH